MMTFKKHNTYFFTFFFFLLSSVVFAQRTGQIIGSVEDKNTLENLLGVNISIEGTNLGTTTDMEGMFKISLPVGTYAVTASYVGYKKVTQYNIEVSSGNDRIDRKSTRLNSSHVAIS